MKQYFIKTMDKKDFSLANTAEIVDFQWMDNDYRPKTLAWVIFVKGEGFYVRMRSYETKLRATCTNYMDPVCNDSCLEFFFNFNPAKGEEYVNFEVNPLGTVNASIGPARKGRVPVKNVWGTMPEVTADVLPDYWQVDYLISLEKLEQAFGKVDLSKGAKYRGNFYKCGDKTEFMHYGMWQPVQVPDADFHRPDHFGELILD